MTTRGLWGKCTDLAPLLPASTPVYQQQPVRAAVTPRAALPRRSQHLTMRLRRRRSHRTEPMFTLLSIIDIPGCPSHL